MVSAELDGGDVLTYTSVAAGVDAQIHTRRVNIAIGYRYQRNIEWQGDVGDTDIHSGVAMVNVQVVPGVLQFDAGALATRTGGEGRALGVTDRDASVEVYSAYAGPTLSTHVGPVSVNANYRLGYVAVDDDRPVARRGDYDSAVAHSAAASVGMGPGRLPIGWNVSAGWARTDTESDFDEEAEGMFVRGDVVVPLGPDLRRHAGVGYENIEASQLDIARMQAASHHRPDGRRSRSDPAAVPDLRWLASSTTPAGLAAERAHRASGPRRPPLWRHHRRRHLRPPVQPQYRDERSGL